MIETIFAWAGITFGSSILLSLILRLKVKTKFELKHVVILPITLLIEEFLFRVIPFAVAGFLGLPVYVPIIGSSIIFGLTHLTNLETKKEKPLEKAKYVAVITYLGLFLGYLYATLGFWMTYFIHLVHDLYCFGVAGILRAIQKRQLRK